ncbi:MAG: response regulator transcription factor [Candidatus Dadabacteria bacterium]|nr:response regulator transcription factor [Candidatus Dadabacteria bacterium]
MKILIADDHPIFRHGLGEILSRDLDVTLVGEAATAAEVFESLTSEDWDILLLDISMPGKSGFDILEELKNLRPNLPVLLVSGHPEELYAKRALKAGAAGYIAKVCIGDELVRAVKKVIERGVYISPYLADKAVRDLNGEYRKEPHETLSRREYQVACMIASGKNLKLIANELNLSVKTVRAHRAAIFEKMEIRSNTELIRYALENRLIY